MTVKVLKSQADAVGDFAAAAATHAVEMRDWRAHMQRVKDDERNGVTGIEKHWPHPRPSSHPLVEAAVNEDSAIDYEIVDDGPTPEQVLRAKKDGLISKVYQLEQQAISAVVPFGRRKLFNLRENAIRQQHAERLAEDGALRFAARAAGILKPVEMPAKDRAHIEAQQGRREKIDAIELAAAEITHAIEDLTIETIDAFEIPTIIRE